jgi:hypothetical protein
MNEPYALVWHLVTDWTLNNGHQSFPELVRTCKWLGVFSTTLNRETWSALAVTTFELTNNSKRQCHVEFERTTSQFRIRTTSIPIRPKRSTRYSLRVRQFNLSVRIENGPCIRKTIHFNQPGRQSIRLRINSYHKALSIDLEADSLDDIDIR